MTGSLKSISGNKSNFLHHLCEESQGGSSVSEQQHVSVPVLGVGDIDGVNKILVFSSSVSDQNKN